MCILHSYCLQLALSVLYHSLQCKHSVFYVLYFPFCIEVEINAKDICVCFTSFSIVKCGQDCSRSVPPCHRADRTCAFVHRTTHLCVLCQHYMCFILLHSAMQCHYTLAPPVFCCPMHCCRHSIALAEIYCTHSCHSLCLDGANWRTGVFRNVSPISLKPTCVQCSLE